MNGLCACVRGWVWVCMRMYVCGWYSCWNFQFLFLAELLIYNINIVRFYFDTLQRLCLEYVWWAASSDLRHSVSYFYPDPTVCACLFLYMTSFYLIILFCRARGMSVFEFRPHCGEAGDPHHLVAAYILADQVAFLLRCVCSHMERKRFTRFMCERILRDARFEILSNFVCVRSFNQTLSKMCDHFILSSKTDQSRDFTT